MYIEKLKESWKEVSLLMALIVSVTSTFLIPLPSWTNSESASPYYIKFIIFFATIISGYLVLISLKNKCTKLWIKLSIILFILLTITIVTYYYYQEIKTLPYEGNSVIIGNQTLNPNPIDVIKKSGKFIIDGDEDILKHVHGKSELIWTKESIKMNRVVLTGLLVLVYTFSASFIVAFSNLFLLFKKEEGNINKNEDSQNK